MGRSHRFVSSDNTAIPSSPWAAEAFTTVSKLAGSGSSLLSMKVPRVDDGVRPYASAAIVHGLVRTRLRLGRGLIQVHSATTATSAMAAM